MTIEFEGFLPDECCTVLGDSIRHAKVFTYPEVGLGPGTKDGKVLEHAREHGAIVITRNRSDFAREARRAAKSSTAGECKAMRCQDGIGLVTVSDALTSFRFDRVTRGLSLGGQQIDWSDVFILNLWVNIDAEENVTVRLLPRCEHCMNNHLNDGCARCSELGIADLYAKQEPVASGL